MCMFSSPSAFVTDSSTKGGGKKKKPQPGGADKLKNCSALSYHQKLARSEPR